MGRKEGLLCASKIDAFPNDPPDHTQEPSFAMVLTQHGSSGVKEASFKLGYYLARIESDVKNRRFDIYNADLDGSGFGLRI